MKKIIFFIVTLAAICVSCKKDPEPFVISAEMEQLGQEYDGKNFLLNEHYLVFEPDDEVLLWKDATNYALAHSSSEGRTVQLWGSEARNGSNYSYGDNNETYSFTTGVLYGVYPASAMMSGTDEHPINNVITGNLSSTPTINYPSSWNYREENPARGIYSFGKEAFPMVAYRSGNGPLGFHSVSGIVRVQFFSTTAATVQSVMFKSYKDNGKFLSGAFTVNDIMTEAPYVTGGSNKSITINSIGQSVGPTQLVTLYLPLPAQVQHNEGAADVRGITQYDLEMVVTSDKGTFTKRFGVDIRRNCITMMPAIEIQAWNNITSEGQTDVHLVGCGTKARPFQVYTFDELVKVRDAYNAQNGTINGQALTENTYIAIVRNDITLDDPYNTPSSDKHDQWNSHGVWSVGIKDFKGHLVMRSNHPTLHGICNNSRIPLFESITSQGHVDSVSIRGGFVKETEMVNNYSPLCWTNMGTMNNCVNLCHAQMKGNMAGICITNSGTLNGCRNEGKLEDMSTVDGTRLAGICLDNSGTVQNCVAIISGVLSTKNTAGGLVHTNKNMVRNSYVNLNNTSGKGHLGGLVYQNDFEVQNCYVNGSFSTQTSYGVGGIAYVNTGNIVDCRNEMLSLKGSKCVGGIAARMTGGEIRNCCLRGPGNITTNTDQVECGGFVGYMTGGKIENCYNVFNCHLGHSNQGSTVGGAVGRIETTSGDNPGVSLFNVYASFNVNFYGAKTGTVKFEECYSPKGSVPTSTTKSRREGIFKIEKDESDGNKLKEVISAGGNTTQFSTTPFATTLDNVATTLNNALGGEPKYRRWQDGTYPVLSYSKSR